MRYEGSQAVAAGVGVVIWEFASQSLVCLVEY